MTNYRAIPKTELHVHLEGAIPLPALFELIEKYGGYPGIAGPDDLYGKFQFDSFPEFIDAFSWKNSFLRDVHDFTFVANALAQEFQRENIAHAEVLYSPTTFAGQNGLTIQNITEAIRGGFDCYPELEILLIADFVRDYGPEHEWHALPALAEVKSSGVVGISLGGSEHAFPPEPFAPLYEEARRLGFRTTVHAGEAVGPQSIWAALNALKPQRIGHGVRAIEDPKLVKHLASHAIPLELCPVSNVKTGVVSQLSCHPIRELFDAGVTVTINTDDPGMFHNGLSEEYHRVEKECGFSPDEMRVMLEMSERSRWS